MTILLEFKRRTLQGRKTVNLSGCPGGGGGGGEEREDKEERRKRWGEKEKDKVSPVSER